MLGYPVSREEDVAARDRETHVSIGTTSAMLPSEDKDMLGNHAGIIRENSSCRRLGKVESVKGDRQAWRLCPKVDRDALKTLHPAVATRSRPSILISTKGTLGRRRSAGGSEVPRHTEEAASTVSTRTTARAWQPVESDSDVSTTTSHSGGSVTHRSCTEVEEKLRRAASLPRGAASTTERCSGGGGTEINTGGYASCQDDTNKSTLPINSGENVINSDRIQEEGSQEKTGASSVARSRETGRRRGRSENCLNTHRGPSPVSGPLLRAEDWLAQNDLDQIRCRESADALDVGKLQTRPLASKHLIEIRSSPVLAGKDFDNEGVNNPSYPHSDTDVRLTGMAAAEWEVYEARRKLDLEMTGKPAITRLGRSKKRSVDDLFLYRQKVDASRRQRKLDMEAMEAKELTWQPVRC